MVRKLFKYEIKSYLRTLLPVNLIVLAIAIFGRIILLFESESVVYDIISTSSFIGLFAGIAALLVMTAIMIVVRFYKNMYTGEGYLTFTLPVTAHQHISVKLITALLFELAAITTVALSGVIITSGELLVELFKAFGYIFENIFGLIGSNLPILIVELVLLVLATEIYNVLLYYTCISIGQRAKKNRIFMAVLVYFAYYVIVQILSTAAVIIAALSASTGIYEILAEFIVEYPFAFIHGVFGISIVFMGLMSLVWYVIVRKTMENHLNLE